MIREERLQKKKLIYEREIRDREHTEKLKDFKLEASALMARDAMIVEDASTYFRCDATELERIISDTKLNLRVSNDKSQSLPNTL